MREPSKVDDSLTDALIRDIRRTADRLPDTFTDLVEGSLLEGYSGRYDGSYPPAGHTYPEVRP
ncbi:MAG: hypothetical protein HOY79_19230 [Streptomyces sp.]|nr:hypothetical protein [Streptomyces sp.]NUS29128.1 hypothetical protein [Streptomyces sp.]